MSADVASVPAVELRDVCKRFGATEIIRGVNLFPSQIEELIVAHPDLSPHYVLEVRLEGTLDELTVKVEPRPDVADHDQACDRKLDRTRVCPITFGHILWLG